MAGPASSLASLLQVNAFACLLLCYLLYVVLGGAVLSAVEGPAERELRARLEELRRSFLRENPCVREGRLGELLGRALSARRSDVAALEADDERRYGFASSLFVVVVTLTTMGSDSYTPISAEAKLFLIFYCTLGIPLTLFLLTLLSKALLLPVVTRAPVHLLHARWGVPRARAALVHAGLLSALVLSLLLPLPALLVCAAEPDWSFLDALFFCFVILSTVGQGGKSLGETWGPRAKQTLELLVTCYLLVGMVAIIALKETVLQVPQVCAAMRLFSGPQYAELEGVRLSEPAPSQDDCDEEPRCSPSVCTISSAPLQQLSSPCSGKPGCRGPPQSRNLGTGRGQTTSL